MTEDKKKLTLVLFSGELDKALAAFNIATTAAAMDKDVTIFFTFWGLNVIKKPGGRVPGTGMLALMNRMNRGGANRLNFSKFNMLGAGTGLMKRFMGRAGLPSLEQMLAMGKQLGVHYIACTTTMGVMGLTEQDFVPEVESFAGAATYLAAADEAGVNLFIS